jgi:hypothetical protein
LDDFSQKHLVTLAATEMRGATASSNNLAFLLNQGDHKEAALPCVQKWL